MPLSLEQKLGFQYVYFNIHENKVFFNFFSFLQHHTLLWWRIVIQS